MEYLIYLSNSPYIRFAVLALLVFSVISVRRRIHSELMALDDGAKQRLNQGFMRIRMIQFSVIGIILLPVILVSFRLPFFVGREAIPFMASAFLLLAWFTAGYEYIKRKLYELRMPESFVKAYVSDRLVMAMTMAILLFLAWNMTPKFTPTPAPVAPGASGTSSPGVPETSDSELRTNEPTDSAIQNPAP